MARPKAPESKARLLDAAERVLLRDGLGSISVDAVIREAGMSKGGFFHHFPTRDELLTALLHRLSEQFARGTLRERVDLAFDMPPRERRRVRVLVTALLEAVQSSARVGAGARQSNQREIAEAVAHGTPEGNAWVVQLALDGLWLGETLGTVSLSPQQREKLRHALRKLTS